jgi:hypothetical protein
MLDHESVLTYKCPDTGRAVRTVIVTDKNTLSKLGAFKLSVWCPYCRTPHKIAGRDASLTYSLPSEGNRSGPVIAQNSICRV